MANALKAEEGLVEALAPDTVRTWLDQVEGGDMTPASLPNLLVVSADLALAEQSALLRVVSSVQPWTFLPLVVVSRVDDPERCRAVYEYGVSGWVVLPEDPPALEAAAGAFARYWLRTTLLPQIEAHARM